MKITVEIDGTVSLIQVRLKKEFDCFEVLLDQIPEWISKIGKFKPAQLNEKPVASVIDIPIACIKPQ